YRNLAIVLLAELPTVLPCHANRVLPLLRKPSVVHDPSSDPTPGLEGRQRPLTNRGQHRLLVPRRVGNKVVHRLVHRAHSSRLNPRPHWLYPLPIPRHHPPHPITPNRLPP